MFLNFKKGSFMENIVWDADVISSRIGLGQTAIL